MLVGFVDYNNCNGSFIGATGSGKTTVCGHWQLGEELQFELGERIRPLEKVSNRALVKSMLAS